MNRAPEVETKALADATPEEFHILIGDAPVCTFPLDRLPPFPYGMCGHHTRESAEKAASKIREMYRNVSVVSGACPKEKAR